MRFAWWVDAGGIEVLFNDGSCVNVLEDSDLSLILISLNFKHLPSEHDVNSALVALLQSNFVGVWESVNFLVGCPVLDAGVVCGAAMKLILSHKVLIVEGVEISAFSLVWELG